MGGVLNGIIGGILAISIAMYFATRARTRSNSGELRFGAFFWVVAIACFALALLPIISTVFWGHNKDFWAKVGLSVGFGFGAIYCFGEAAFVRGIFNSEGVTFRTPWTGLKEEKWKDLRSSELNVWCNWYTLKFKSGATVRLSLYLEGHRSALEAAGVSQ